MHIVSNRAPGILTLGAISLLVLGLIAGMSRVAVAQGLSQVEIHGFASQGYIRSSDHDYLVNSRDGSAEYQEFAFNFSSEISDDLRMGAQFFARDLGVLGNNEISLDWAFGDYRWQDELGFRAGRFKMPYGLYNETADFDGVRTAVLLPQSVYDLRFRDLLVAVNGVQLYGNVDAKRLGDFDYTGFYGNIYAPSNGSVARFFSDRPITEFDRLESDLTTGGSIMWNTPLSGLRLGHSMVHYDGTLGIQVVGPAADQLASFGQGPEQDLTFSNANFHVSSIEYAYNDLVLASEYSLWLGDFENPFVGLDVAWEKWYMQGSYRLNDWFEFGSYYSIHYEDKDDHEGKKEVVDHRGWQKDFALSTRFDVSYAMTVKFEVHFIDGTAMLLRQANEAIVTDPGSVGRNWKMFTAKTSFVF